MFKNYLITLICSLALVTMTACSSKNDQSSLVEDGSDASLGLDSDGALTVGEPNGSADGWNGPAELADNHTIYFAYNSENIQDQYLGVMQANAAYLKKNPEARVIIEGHTDERGSREYNLALGERRAQAAQAYLATSGVSASRMEAISYGEDQPADPGHDESAWAKNRRAEVSY